MEGYQTGFEKSGKISKNIMKGQCNEYKRTLRKYREFSLC